ncbi:MAG: UPF0262 family protein [Pseudomonadota bacterium]
MSSTKRLISVHLDETVFERSSADVEHERRVAIYDLLEENSFAIAGHDGGPYRLELSIQDKRLVFKVADEQHATVATHILALSPFRKIIKDYFMICESYFEAIKSATPSRIEAIDMGRRGVHNEGSQVLIDRLSDKIDLDFDTARRLFTLVCALHWRG